MTMMEWIRKATSTKDTRALEMDLARLRAENRALLNSILGIAGVPPIVVADNDVSPAAGLKSPALQPAVSVNGLRPAARMGSGAPRNGLVAAVDKKAAPMRRRSWQQIYRMLEINSARKKDAGEIV
jgi:hypothetical protein